MPSASEIGETIASVTPTPVGDRWEFQFTLDGSGNCEHIMSQPITGRVQKAIFDLTNLASSATIRLDSRQQTLATSAAYGWDVLAGTGSTLAAGSVTAEYVYDVSDPDVYVDAHGYHRFTVDGAAGDASKSGVVVVYVER